MLSKNIKEKFESLGDAPEGAKRLASRALDLIDGVGDELRLLIREAILLRFWFWQKCQGQGFSKPWRTTAGRCSLFP